MSSFVEKSLLSGEKIKAAAAISWLSQFWYFFFSLLTWMTIVFPIILILLAIINVVTTELAVTNKKVIGKTGFISRTSIDLPLSKLESINIHQDILGRVFRYGTVSIHGVGGSNVKIPYIKHPLDFRRVVMRLVEHKEQTSPGKA